MASRIQKVHYIEDFKFKIQLELDKNLFYRLICKTVGINEYVATWDWVNDVWVCENCAIEGDEITVFVTDHKLPAGKVMCHVEMIDGEGMSNCIQVDPNIFLSFIPVNGPTDIDDLDEEQTLDIIRLDDEIKAIKEKYSDYDAALSEIENNYGKAAQAHHKRLDKIDEILGNNNTTIEKIKTNVSELQELQTSLSSRLNKEVDKLNDRITNLVINSGGGNTDLTDVYKQINENKTAIQVLKNYVDNLEIPAEVDLTPITEKLTALEAGLRTLEGIDHSKFLTEHQDISYLATKEELSEAISNIPATDLSQYYTKSEVDTKIDDAVNNVDVDLTNYVTLDTLTTKLGDYANKTYVTNSLAEAKQYTDTVVGALEISGGTAVNFIQDGTTVEETEGTVYFLYNEVDELSNNKTLSPILKNINV